MTGRTGPPRGGPKARPPSTTRAQLALRMVAAAERRTGLAAAGPDRWTLYRPDLLLGWSGRPLQLIPGDLTGRSTSAGTEPVHAPDPGPAADAILLAKLATRLERVRAFHVGTHEPPCTLAVHQRRHPWRSGRLMRGAAMLTSLRPLAAYGAPRLLDHGGHGGLEWTVEELLVGEHVTADDPTAIVRELSAAMAITWRRTGHRRLPTRLFLRRRMTGTVTALLDGLPADVVGPGGELSARLTQLLGRTRALSVGPCHGDPTLGNVLRLRDGRLALVDWEMAGEQPLARDLVKLAVSLPDPVAAVDAVEPAATSVGGRFATSWRAEAAVVLTAWLAGASCEQEVAERSGRLPAFRRRVSARARLLRELLAAA